MNDESQSARRQTTRGHETTATDPRQVVLAPEQVELHLPVAGPTSRMLAYAIDGVIVIIIELGVIAFVLLSTRWAAPLIDWIVAAVPDDLQPEDIEQFLQSDYVFYIFAALVLLQSLAELTYFTLWETVWSGRSPGKSVLRLRVVSDGGRPITLQESLVRNLLRIVDILPANYIVGLGAILLSNEGKRLGDVAAGTIVIRLDRPLAPPALAPMDEGAGAFRFERAQVAKIGPLDRRLILETLRRLETLDAEHAGPLLDRTVNVICRRIGYGDVPADEHRAFLHALLRAT